MIISNKYRLNMYQKCHMPLQMAFDAIFDTGLHADCVRFVPGLEEDHDECKAIFSCYELDELSGKRRGKLLLAEKGAEDQQVNVIQCINDISGVFDFNWFTSNILVTALAEGPPKLFKYENGKLETMKTECEEVDLEMTLAVAGELELFLTCDNKGLLRQWNLNSDGNLTVERCWTGHDAEIWYISQDLRDKNLFYTGSDDYSMKVWDIRCENGSPAMITNKTGHEAGVCCIESSPWDEFIIATGSYDENVRLWDRRSMRPGPLKTVNCGSGAWRLRWNPKEKDLMAVAGMRSGFHVLDLSKEAGDDVIIQSELVSDHVAYGIDWHPNGKSLASCSFYNNQGQFFSHKRNK